MDGAKLNLTPNDHKRIARKLIYGPKCQEPEIRREIRAILDETFPGSDLEQSAQDFIEATSIKGLGSKTMADIFLKIGLYLLANEL